MILALFLVVSAPTAGWALAPEEVLVVVNARSDAGRELADYYMHRRGIPGRHRILLSTPEQETIDAATYQERMARPLQAWFDDPVHSAADIRCLLLFYGLPLRINARDPELAAKIANQKQMQNALRAEVNALGEKDPKRRELATRLDEVEEALDRWVARTPRAAVDSELALVRVGDYERRGWLPNPYYLGYRAQKLKLDKDRVLMVSRLDGPSAKVVRRMIDDSLAAEEKGLTGNACVDARWPAPKAKQSLHGYARYDASLHQWAAHLAVSWPGERFFDETAALFGPGACPDTALYCGWYSLGRYVDAFTWRPGAVAYHIASGECTTLKRAGSRVWCKRLLEEGVAATLGPVYEPYVQAFPLPSLFFGLLTEGYLTLAECFQVSLPYLSWQMVLVGDPLYRPFRSR
ncbi:MAG: TIGR03790 family protein [Desulfosarcinaceae bacterium]